MPLPVLFLAEASLASNVIFEVAAVADVGSARTGAYAVDVVPCDWSFSFSLEIGWSGSSCESPT